MKIRGISSSSMRTYKPKSSTPFPFPSSSYSHQNNPFRILHSITNNTPTITTTTTHHADDDAICRFIDPPPSQTEVHDALSSLQRVLALASRVELLRDTYCNKSENELSNLDQVSEDDPDTDWLEPSLFPYNPKLLQANGSESDRVYYAIHLLQTDPSVQKLVKSLSTDETVWEAVLNNDVVQELRESISADQGHDLQSLDDIANDDPDNTTNVLIWLLSTAPAKFMEVIKKITKIVINFFQRLFNKTAAHREDSQPFIEKLRAAFMLSIMVLLIVVVRRIRS
ncbi:unnamed protein product [Trifolium pratense]|uniref:Uncharacterized protein n=1 Tax=Trifolium pratense TaxID=57577 RepID=A0ACB0KFB5_TRIPR|nr:unnamed protein product [Trifolium pratense]